MAGVADLLVYPAWVLKEGPGVYVGGPIPLTKSVVVPADWMVRKPTISESPDILPTPAVAGTGRVWRQKTIEVSCGSIMSDTTGVRKVMEVKL